jgi:hypothetical protein
MYIWIKEGKEKKGKGGKKKKKKKKMAKATRLAPLGWSRLRKTPRVFTTSAEADTALTRTHLTRHEKPRGSGERTAGDLPQ